MHSKGEHAPRFPDKWNQHCTTEMLEGDKENMFARVVYDLLNEKHGVTADW